MTNIPGPYQNMEVRDLLGNPIAASRIPRSTKSALKKINDLRDALDRLEKDLRDET